jgi:hypothetical protein
MASITLDHIGKNYTPEVTVIRDLSFDIRNGDFMVLCGALGLRQVHHAAHDRRAGGPSASGTHEDR